MNELPRANAYVVSAVIATPLKTNKRKCEVIEELCVQTKKLASEKAKLINQSINELSCILKNAEDIIEKHEKEISMLQTEQYINNKSIEEKFKVIKVLSDENDALRKPNECIICMTHVSDLILNGTTIISCENKHHICSACANAKISASFLNANEHNTLECGYEGCSSNLKNHLLFNKVIDPDTLKKWNNACMEARVRKEVEEEKSLLQNNETANIVVKRPCCNKPMPTTFDGCMSFDCPDCNKVFCGCCFKTFAPKGNNLAENNALFRCHEHIRFCKHNYQKKNGEDGASYDPIEEQQKLMLKRIWAGYFIKKALIQRGYAAKDTLKFYSKKVRYPHMLAYCKALGIPDGPFGYLPDPN